VGPAHWPAPLSPDGAGHPFIGDVMRLLIETVLVALAALSGEPPAIQGLIPPR
jgi:hypothetical protein